LKSYSCRLYPSSFFSYPSLQEFFQHFFLPAYFWRTSMALNQTLYTDQAILEGIRLRDSDTLSAVYRQFRPRITALIGSLNGSEQEAKDIFQEAIVVVFINVQKPGFQLTSSFYTYLHAVSHNLWLKKFREKKRHNGVSLDAPEVLKLGIDPSGDLEHAERGLFIMEKFRALGDGCRELLQMAVIEEKSPAEIVERLGFGSLAYYYKRKSMCKDKLTELTRRDVRFGSI
jgi:RNA polymerase sigma factor (sigma-70 family)